MIRARSAWLVVVCAGAMSAACSAILGLDAPPGPDDASTQSDAIAPSEASPGDDGGVPEAQATCAPLDATSDATGDAAGDATFNPLALAPIDDAGTPAWDFFDTAAFTANTANAFSGGAFDGRYVYFAGRGQWVTRYDTTAGQAGFEDASAEGIDGGPAWAGVRVSSLGVPGTIPGGFFGAVFDGRYVYFVPFGTGAGNGSVAARYDSQGPLGAASSWASLDLSTLPNDGGAVASGFTGGAFDGRYVYFFPRNDGVPDGRVLRYDTLASDAGSGGDAGDAGDAGGATSQFAEPSQWSSFDVSTINAGAVGFGGGVFDGKSIELVPSVNDIYDAAVHNGGSGIAVRLSSGAAFEDAAAWSTFDTTRVNGIADEFFGAAFDGQYLYFAPRANGVAVRFDTKAAGGFGAVASWSSFNVTPVVAREGGGAPSFLGAAFDGRFVYYAPITPGFGVVARYDTLSPFGAACAWSTVDLTQAPNGDGGYSNFAGAIFDGTYVYFVPSSGGVVARFHARAPEATEPFQGSFL